MAKRPQRDQWDDEDLRPRVLIECRPEDSPSIIGSVIERHGYAVRTCDGPTTDPCDLLAHGSCSLVEGADVVVNLLHTGPTEQAVLDAVTSRRRPPEIVAELGNAKHMTRSTLLRRIDQALAARDEPIPRWGDGHS